MIYKKHYKYLLNIFITTCVVLSFCDTSIGQHSTYYYQKTTLYDELPKSKNSIYFIGDSITDTCEWSEMFCNENVKNRGISGDVTQGVLDRLDGILVQKPKKIFLMIGINDLARGKTTEYVVTNLKKIADHINNNSPKTKLFVQSILPVNDSKGMFKNHCNKNAEVLKINNEIQNIADRKFHFIDLHSEFINAEGKLDTIYTNDGLHINGDGYMHWKNQISKYVK